MNKDSEVLEILDKLEECAYAMKDLPMSNWIDLADDAAELDLKIMDWVETIKSEFLKGKQSLQRLEAIGNSNPSEALKALDRNIVVIREKDYTIIEQALLKAQEQEKALEIIKKKNVNIGLVNVLGSVEQYNQTYVYDNMLNVKWCLTQEEFELLKKVFYEMV